MKTLTLLIVALLSIAQSLGVRKGLHHESVFGSGKEHEARIINGIREARVGNDSKPNP